MPRKSAKKKTIRKLSKSKRSVKVKAKPPKMKSKVTKPIDPKYKTPAASISKVAQEPKVVDPVKVEEKLVPESISEPITFKPIQLEPEETIDLSSLEPELAQCKLKGIIRKGSNFGNDVFAADPTPHQFHSKDFTCQDVLFMEKEFGRHAEGCAHVGYWTSKVCKCKGNV